MQEINANLDRCNEKQLRRKELLYKDWYLNVYEPIQVEIYKNMHCYKADYAKWSRDTKYVEYLSRVNQQGGVFQEDFDEAEYDPTNLVRVDAPVHKRLKDPTRVGERKTFVEDNTLLRARFGKNFSLKQIERTKLPVISHDNQTRADLDWNAWLLSQFGHVDSTARLRSA